MGKESKNELNLPLEKVYDRITKDHCIINSESEAVCCDVEPDIADFIVKAVNTFHNREELINELIDTLKYIKRRTDYFEMPIKLGDLIQKSEDMIDE